MGNKERGSDVKNEPRNSPAPQADGIGAGSTSAGVGTGGTRPPCVSLEPRVWHAKRLRDLSQPQIQRPYGQRAEELASGGLARALGASPLGTGNEVGLRLAFSPGNGDSSSRLFFRVPQLAALAPDHALRPFFELSASSVPEAIVGLDQAGSLHVFVVTAGEQVVDLDSGQPGYALLPLIKQTSGVEWRELLDGVLGSLRATLTIDILLKAVSLSGPVLSGLRTEIEHLWLLESAFDTEHRRSGRVADLARKSDPVAGRLREDLQKVLELVLSGAIFETTIRVATPAFEAGMLVSRVIGSSLASGQRFEVLSFSPGDKNHEEAVHLFRSFEAYPEGNRPVESLCPADVGVADKLAALRASDPARELRLRQIGSLNRVVGFEVAAAMLRLPTSRGPAFATVALDTSCSSRQPTGSKVLRLGRIAETGQVLLVEGRQLLRHVFCTGFTGSGKTVTTRELVRQVVEILKVPCLVFEPAKGEYRTLFRRGAFWEDCLRVFTAGLETLSGVRLNPLAVPPGCTVEEHIGAVALCLAAAMPLWGPLEAFLDAGLRRAYAEAGVDEEALGEECECFPTMDSLLGAIRTIASEAGYQGEVASNLDAAIRQRIEPLTRGSVGRIFRTDRSFPAIADFLRWPTVIELQALRRDHQSFLVLLYLTALLRHLRTLGPSRELRLVIVIEEAHNLLGAGMRGNGSKEEADPQGQAAQFLVKLLAEIRAYGVSIVVVDQIPSAVAPEVTKNTGLKIGHNTLHGGERDTMADAMLLDPAMAEILTRLQPGEALVFFSGLYRAVQVLVEAEGVEDEPPSDIELLGLLSRQAWFRDAATARTAHGLDALMGGLREALAAQVRAVRAKGRGAQAKEGQIVSLAGLVGRKVERRLAWLGRAAGTEAAERLGFEFRRRQGDLLRQVADVLSVRAE